MYRICDVVECNIICMFIFSLQGLLNITSGRQYTALYLNGQNASVLFALYIWMLKPRLCNTVLQGKSECWKKHPSLLGLVYDGKTHSAAAHASLTQYPSLTEDLPYFQRGLPSNIVCLHCSLFSLKTACFTLNLWTRRSAFDKAACGPRVHNLSESSQLWLNLFMTHNTVLSKTTEYFYLSPPAHKFFTFCFGAGVAQRHSG